MTYRESFQHTKRLLGEALTRPQLEEARLALSHHLDAYPQDEIRDMGHALPRLWEYLEEREESSRQLGLSPAEHEERERLFETTRIVVNPFEDEDALAQLEAARARVLFWLDRFPNDPMMRDRLETLDRDLALNRDILLWAAEATPVTT